LYQLLRAASACGRNPFKLGFKFRTKADFHVNSLT
jgi:hypothetical protein